jgi:CelD/BcsL family acetyltransferase involved in cellulose biosynthesis
MSDPGILTAGSVSVATARSVAPAVGQGIEVVATTAGLAALRPEWDAFFARAGLPQQVFQSHAFLTHWARHYLEPSMTPHVVVARRDGRIVMLWPLVLRRRFGACVLQVMGAPVAQFGDVLAEPGIDAEVVAAAWSALDRSGADLFLAQKIRADSALLGLQAPRRPVLLSQSQAPFADLAGRVGSDGPGTAYPARERSAYRRRLRRLAELGEIALRSLPPGEAAGLARQAVAFKRDWLKRNAILSPTMSDPRFVAFFEDCAADPDSALRISTIERDGRPIGIDLSFDCKGSSFGHVIASDPDCEREGIGSILIHHVFATARQRGSATFDMLAPADPYKLRHADGETGVQDLAYVFTPRGRLYCEAVLKRARPLARDFAKKLPAGLVRRLGSG